MSKPVKMNKKDKEMIEIMKDILRTAMHMDCFDEDIFDFEDFDYWLDNYDRVIDNLKN